MIYLYCILGFLGYCFIGRIVYNFQYVLFIKKENIRGNGINWDGFNETCSVLWFISTPIFISIQGPFKFADLICDPSNYKFRIKLEKK